MSNGAGKRGPTSRDVAKRAKVSQSTVSLVFSGKHAGRIAAETRLVVLKAAEELGYRPNASARALKLGTQRLIALAVPNVSNPFFAAVLKAAADVARDHGYGIVLINAGDEPAAGGRLIESLTAHAFDGLIAWESAWVAQAAGVLPATVIVADGDGPVGADVFISAPRIVATAVDHLVGLGHRRIARFGFDIAALPFRARASAFCASIARHALPLESAMQISVPFGSTASIEMTDLLTGGQRPTAVLCDDDLLAPLVYRAARIAGLSVPDDVSVVGIGDIDLASLLDPQLTTVAIPALAVGEAVIEAALRKIEDGANGPPRTIATHLITRHSTAPVRPVKRPSGI